jgi:hypothetical protein
LVPVLPWARSEQRGYTGHGIAAQRNGSKADPRSVFVILFFFALKTGL